jgi:preprotein translocase subunit SecE
MAKKPGKRPQAMKARAAKTAAAISPASALAAEAGPRKPPFNPIQFAQEVRAEARKITWTSWKETWITSVMVFIMVTIMAIFFWVLDISLGFGMTGILKLANPGS